MTEPKPTNPELRARILLYRALCDTGHHHDMASEIVAKINPESLTADGKIDFAAVTAAAELFPAEFDRTVEAAGGRQLDAIALAESMLAGDTTVVQPLLPVDIVASNALHAAQTGLTVQVLTQLLPGRERAMLDAVRKCTLDQMADAGGAE